jgi:hypothetical protein
MIQLLTFLWLFDTSQPAHTTLTGETPQTEFAAPVNVMKGFTLKLRVDLKKFDGETEILGIPEVLSVRLRQHDPGNRERQNYPAFKMADGTVPVLEAKLLLHEAGAAKGRDMTLGIPFALLPKPEGEHEVILNFSGVRWTMYVDGQLLDNDFPLGYPRWVATNRWKLDSNHVRKAALYFPATTPESQQRPAGRTAPVQYWTPPGHNAWVGDVATFFHQGRYHVFYLYDRRHHQSKFGKGAHYFEHLSTADFKTWTEHEAATPLEEQWECIGTGTPFVFDGKLCLAYGLHTERIYPDDKTTLPAQMNHLKAQGRTGSFDRSTPGAPIGSTYSISRDGMAKFEKTWIFFHPCRNPSVYRAPGGELRMLANHHGKGMWESESIDGGWRCLNPDFPPGGDCTFFFRRGGYDYIIGGFKDLWAKPAEAPDSAYENQGRKGLDFYDGSNVPAITQVGDGRYLMAAWIPIHGWGGNLVIRELLQFPGGRIGSKWMREITPEAGQPRSLRTTVAGTATFPMDRRSFLLEFNVRPVVAKAGRVGVLFLPEEAAANACELQLDLSNARAQFAPGTMTDFAAREKSLREGGQPHSARNYAIESLIGVDEAFLVRVLVKGDDKIGGSLLDAEIAGARTMISYRPNLTVKKLLLRTEGAELTDVRISPLHE